MIAFIDWLEAEGSLAIDQIVEDIYFNCLRRSPIFERSELLDEGALFLRNLFKY